MGEALFSLILVFYKQTPMTLWIWAVSRRRKKEKGSWYLCWRQRGKRVTEPQVEFQESTGVLIIHHKMDGDSGAIGFFLVKQYESMTEFSLLCISQNCHWRMLHRLLELNLKIYRIFSAPPKYSNIFILFEIKFDFEFCINFNLAYRHG